MKNLSLVIFGLTQGCSLLHPQVDTHHNDSVIEPSVNVDASFRITEGDGCDNGLPISLAMVEQNVAQVCAALEPWMIARIGEGGSISGQGYQCEIKQKDTRNLGHSLCSDVLQINGDVLHGSGFCPQGMELASFYEVSSNIELFCNRLNEWEIYRLRDGASISGPGYNCNLIEYDDRHLGGSFCH